MLLLSFACDAILLNSFTLLKLEFFPKRIKLPLEFDNKSGYVADSDVFTVLEARAVRIQFRSEYEGRVFFSFLPNFLFLDLPLGPVEAAVNQGRAVNDGKLVVHISGARTYKKV